MNVVDSSGWLEYFDDPIAGAVFAPALQDTVSLIVPTICLFEVHRVIARRRTVNVADEYVQVMSTGRVIALDAGIAVRASECAMRYRLATADAIIYATAQAHNAMLWTQDAHFEGLPNVRYFAKRASS